VDRRAGMTCTRYDKNAKRACGGKGGQLDLFLG
jgi:hypothetical protein